MRFLLIAALVLAALCGQVSAQQLPGGFPPGAFSNKAALDPPTGGGGGCSPGTHASTFLARTSGLSGTETTAYCNLINGLDTDSTFALFDALYIFATNTTTTANLNLVSTNYSLSTTGSCTFTADHGFTGDGSTCYKDTNFDPATASSPNMTASSAMHGVYVLTNSSSTPGSEMDDIGANHVSGGSGDAFNYIIAMFTDGNSYGSILDSVNNGPQAVGNVDGLWMVTATGSTTVFYRNGSSLASNSITPVNVANSDYFILARNQPTTAGGLNPTNFSSHQLSAAWMGGVPNGTQAANIASRINAFMTALGINTY